MYKQFIQFLFNSNLNTMLHNCHCLFLSFSLNLYCCYYSVFYERIMGGPPDSCSTSGPPAVFCFCVNKPSNLQTFKPNFLPHLPRLPSLGINSVTLNDQ